MENKIIEEAAKKYGTPTYLFDADAARDRIKLTKELLGEKYGVCYAMKANSFLAGRLSDTACRLEVCSPGEYEICYREQVDYDKIIISGVNKTEESMDRIVGLSGGRGIYTVESERHAEILLKTAQKHNVKLNIQIRLTAGNQFGVDEETWMKIAKMIMESEELTLVGLHYYSGTQKKMTKIQKELAYLDEFGAKIKAELSIDKLELEYGPGLSVNYFVTDNKPSAEEQLADLKVALDEVKSYDDITVEMGRFLASECGYFLTSVVDKKTNKGHNYCIIDGGIHQLNYFGQMMGMNHPFTSQLPKRTENEQNWNVCGSLCTTNDVITKELPLHDLEINDIIVFNRCGAYSVTEGMALFLSRDLPKVVIYEKEKGFVLVRDTMETNILNSQRI